MANNAHTILQLAGQLAAATGKTIIVFTACNSGGGQNWSRMFPSLHELQITGLQDGDGDVALTYDSAEEARDVFQTIAREATENYTAIIEGEIHLVTGNGGLRWTTRTFDLASKFRPVFEDGTWRDEIAPWRI